jgi:hypothetical protein
MNTNFRTVSSDVMKNQSFAVEFRASTEGGGFDAHPAQAVRIAPARVTFRKLQEAEDAFTLIEKASQQSLETDTSKNQ